MNILEIIFLGIKPNFLTQYTCYNTAIKFWGPAQCHKAEAAANIPQNVTFYQGLCT